MKTLLVKLLSILVFFAFGYAEAYGDPSDTSFGFIGGDYFFGGGISNKEYEKDHFERLLHWTFRLVFFLTAITVMCGSLSERIPTNSYFLVGLFVSALVYPPVQAWTTGGGFLYKWGYKDLAGGSSVLGFGGMVGVTGSIFIGPRLGRFKRLRKKTGGVGEIKLYEPQLSLDDILDMKTRVVRRT